MEIERPTWHTKQICPDCRQSNPTLCYCIKCGFVTLICEETGDTFMNPKELSLGFADICPNCGEENTTDFAKDDSDRITKAGFKRQEYQ